MGVLDPKGIVADIPRSHGWQYEKQIPLDSKELLDYAIPLIRMMKAAILVGTIPTTREISCVAASHLTAASRRFVGAPDSPWLSPTKDYEPFAVTGSA